MATAELGDEQLREDPTVNELQRRAAELLGQEAALFLPTATMANQIALEIHTRPGRLLIAQERTHVMIFEAGGPAVHSGLVMVGLPAEQRSHHARADPRGRLAERGCPPRQHRRLRADPPKRRRTRLAAGRARRLGRRGPRARARRPPRRGADHERRRGQRDSGRGVWPPRRQRHHLLLEGPRLPAGRGHRLVRGSDRTRLAREVPVRRRDAAGRRASPPPRCTRSTTTSTASPTTTPAPGGWPRASPTPASPSTWRPSRRTSSAFLCRTEWRFPRRAHGSASRACSCRACGGRAPRRDLPRDRGRAHRRGGAGDPARPRSPCRRLSRSSPSCGAS